MTCGMRLTKRALATVVTLVIAAGAAKAELLDFKPLTLINNWEQYSQLVRAPMVAIDSEGTVYLRGAISQSVGSNAHPFVLPKAYRPKRTVYVRISLVVGRAGRLAINADGTVIIQANGVFQYAQAFTSLEGASFSKN
jgi:hypothetical protein